MYWSGAAVCFVCIALSFIHSRRTIRRIQNIYTRRRAQLRRRRACGATRNSWSHTKKPEKEHIFLSVSFIRRIILFVALMFDIVPSIVHARIGINKWIQETCRSQRIRCADIETFIWIDFDRLRRGENDCISATIQIE